MRIFLTGMMGSGKSWWCKKAGEHLGVPAIDVDDMIEQGEKKSIHQLFREMGEPGFRKIEYEYLNEAIGLYADCVMACGGGSPCFENAMELLNNSGKTIYLKMSAAALYERLKDQLGSRPLLNTFKTRDEIVKRIHELLEVREPVYLQSHMIIDAERISRDDILKKITQLYV